MRICNEGSSPGSRPAVSGGRRDRGWLRWPGWG
jgi:hypothetical protein